MQKFKGNPVVIEAVQWNGNNLLEVIRHTGQKASAMDYKWEDYEDLVSRNGLTILTPEGVMDASIGDWITKNVNGECYPCKPDIFEAITIPCNNGFEIIDCDHCEKSYADISIMCKNSVKHKKPTLVELIVSDIENEIKGRRGIGREYTSCDADIQQEIRESFGEIIKKHLYIAK
jgi:hypothetical protein